MFGTNNLAAKLAKNKGMIAAAFAVAIGGICAAQSAHAAEQAVGRQAYVAVGENTRAPIGWKQFCQDHPDECNVSPAQAVDVQLTKSAYKEMERINRYVNDHVKPMTDLDHFGVVEKWSYPDDGYGDCEDYVLEKRRRLIQAGWPRAALLITVVRDKKGDGHAVLTVRTDKGEYVLDNQEDEILPWSETGYRFVKRQSQTDVNVWVSLGDNRPTNYVAGTK
jgi:predicted transglutaminase-like cysteine proteinase